MKRKQSSKNPNQKVRVLYQNLGGTWYAFTAVGDEVFFGIVPLKQSKGKSAGKAKQAKAPKTTRQPDKQAA